MAWIDTARVVAEMVYLHSWWYWPNEMLIGPPVGSYRFSWPLAYSELAVSAMGLSNPDPACVGFVDERVESILCGVRVLSHENLAMRCDRCHETIVANLSLQAIGLLR